MTISYSFGIPNPPNDPADDVATMQSNALAISDIIAVDHVGFNFTGGGQHNQVTFNANRVPVFAPPSNAINPPVLFTNTQDGKGNSLPGTLAELFFYSGNTAQSKNQYNVTASNGSVMLPMGIIVKWGNQVFSGTQNPGVTFTDAFPNACFGVWPSILNANYAGFTPSSSNPTPMNVLTSQTGTNGTTGFTARVTGNGSAGNITYFWLAIGN